ncbi:coniferyl aldehyde dehydrogenase [Phyllobacterium leguminum]|uniref:Aldehyde dehydrogenase n=1 Tax=Phyllobacterium leguminum TaxID=314237 RepID=A0A318SYX6_9HYPH|nr:coniferyl aldehyde dehydrogenase [Phyllobacterium leguminum]PYE86577.1 coniferyl-aldehyde dehydrogenase [Phyllobacterium leguminum]
MSDIDPLRFMLKRQREAFDEEMHPSLEVRRDRLNRIGRLLKENQAALCEAVSRDFGHRSHHETIQLEIAPLMGALRHTRARLRRWMKPERRSRSLEFLQFSNWVQYQPLGVIGIMVPWNYPLLLALGPLIDILAAGNRAMIKPSELLPVTSALLARLAGTYFKPEEVAVTEGGVETAEAFSALPFDHLIFTGSTAVARKVMAAAAENLTPLTLELGGKSPAIIAPDYPVAQAARDIAFGKLMNAGQTCIAPDYVLIERSKLETFAAAFIATAETFYPRQSGETHYTSLVGERAHDRLMRGIGECRARGVKLMSAGIALPAKGVHIPPTLVIDPPADCLLMEEEIFGPVLPLIPYDDFDAALKFIRERPRPLALYLFTCDKAIEEKALRNTISGNVTVNGTLLHIAQNDLPFGGIGPSGIGAYHGHEGFKRFSHARGIAKVRIFNPARLAMPPYGRIAALLARFMMRG